MSQKLPPAPRPKKNGHGQAPQVRRGASSSSAKKSVKTTGNNSNLLAIGLGLGGAGLLAVIVALILLTRPASTSAEGASTAAVVPVINGNTGAEALTTGTTVAVSSSPSDAKAASNTIQDSTESSHSSQAVTAKLVEPIDPAVDLWLSDFPAQASALRGKVQALGTSDLTARLRDPALRRELVRHEILRQFSPKELLVFLKSPSEQAFLKEFFSQTLWMEEFVGSGSFKNPVTGLLALAAMAEFDPEIRKPSLEQKIATSVALETAMSDQTPVNAVQIYRYYRDRNRQGKLHPGFVQLDIWEMRFAVAATVTFDELSWIGNRASFSPTEARSAAWQVHYLGDSPFGDSIQSAWYYMPWSERLNYTQKTVRVGGVCGSLSTTGALSAKADGIPATTMGEPGHCAFAVRPERGKWVDGNSVDGNHRTPHRNYFEANWADLFAGDAAWMHPNLREAQYLAWATEVLPQEETNVRTQIYKQATIANPFHYGFQAKYFDLLQQQNAPIVVKSEAAQLAVTTFQRTPETSWLLIKRFCQGATSSSDRVALQKIWLAGYEKPVENLVMQMPLDRIVEEMGKQRDQAAKSGLFGDVLQTTISNDKIFARFLDACQKMAAQDVSLKEGLLAGLAAAATSTASNSEDALKSLCRQGILLAEQTADKSAFYALSELGAKFIKPNYKTAHKPYSGVLLSEGGIPAISTTCRWDEPLEHAGILKESGGRFHTDQEANPALVVELGKQGNISGIAIVNIDGGNSARAVPFKVAVSIDGKNWQQVYKANKNEKVWQIDLTSRRPLAKYVRIEGDYPDGRKDFLHLNGVYVYGKPAQ